jgi:hypothetical protein
MSLNKIFNIRKIAIKRKEKAEKERINQLFETNKLSPRTYNRKKKSLEVWVTKEHKRLSQKKKEFKSVLTNTLELLENTNKNKNRIKKLLSNSKMRKQDFWSDLGEGSIKSFTSSSVLAQCQNMSFNSYQYIKIFKPSTESSVLSTSFNNK